MSSSEKPKISALVVAHNEEDQLAECLECLAFADELVVVLDKCTDGSESNATASANTDIAGTEPSAAVPPAVEKVSEKMQPDVVQGVSSEVPSPNLSNHEATATEPSPGDSRIPAQADAAAEASKSAI